MCTRAVKATYVFTKEPSIFAEETDVSQKSREFFANKPCIPTETTNIQAKEPYVLKEPCVFAKEPLLSAEEPSVSGTFFAQKKKNLVQQAPGLRKRGLCFQKDLRERALNVK